MSPGVPFGPLAPHEGVARHQPPGTSFAIAARADCLRRGVHVAIDLALALRALVAEAALREVERGVGRAAELDPLAELVPHAVGVDRPLAEVTSPAVDIELRESTQSL